MKIIIIRKTPLSTRTILFSITLCFLMSCSDTVKEGRETPISFAVDTTMIPKDTILATAENLNYNNGYYYLNGKPLSGYIKEYYNNHVVKSIASYYNGMQHGTTTTFHENGKLRDSRSYRENRSFGKHIGYWENGNQKFDFYYINDKREGSNKQWYQSGQPYAFLHFKDDKECGMQQAWRKNGKVYMNYEAKDGIRYGLQKANLCYTLEDEKFKSVK